MMVAVMKDFATIENPGVTVGYSRIWFLKFIGPRRPMHDATFRLYRYGPNFTWDSHRVTTNSLGMIGPERDIAKPPHTRRIALLGSSLSAGHLIQSNETYSALLEKRLNAVHPYRPGEQFEILNFACEGYTLPQILDVAVEDAPRFTPDVYMVDLNELEVFGNWSWQLVVLIRNRIDAKYDFLRATFRQARVSPTDEAQELFAKLVPYRVPMVRRILVELKANAERHHAGMLAILLPVAEAGEMSKNRVAWVKEVLQPLGIPVVDALDTFDEFPNPEPLLSSREDPHPNNWGNALIFENLYRKLRAQPEAWTALVGSAPPD
jgi:hypothetical protein